MKMKKEGLWLPKEMQPRTRWICMWKDENNKLVVNEEMDYFCAESFIKGDKRVERNMKDAVRSFGVMGGRPVWQEGRKITKTEWEVQMERMLDGEIPDEREAHYVELEEEYLNEHGLSPNDGV